ncbi:MAG: class I SAM-dependent methyltransferase [Pseudomonadota bacterium]
MKDRFEQIYANNEWRHGSGEGSFPINNVGYVDMLQRFMREHRIRTVIDLGCGDWQFSKDIDWGEASYHGYDLVASVVARNVERFATDSIRFTQYGGDLAELPAADLLIAKDVLQHWSNGSIERFLRILPRYRYALITNCVNPTGDTVNRETEDGGFRYLDIRLAPFFVRAEEIYQFRQHRGLLKKLLRRPQWLKRSLLIENPPAA